MNQLNIKLKVRFMKNLKPSLFALMSVVLLFSCKKSDLKEELASDNSQGIASTVSLKESSWKTLPKWNQVNQQSYSIYYSSLKDANITADVANDGLVLVYKKDATKNTTVELPYEEKVGNTTYYWYYQISEGKVLVSCDIYGTSNTETLSTANNFKYIPISKDALSKLEGKGYSRTQLMALPYEQVSGMTNGTIE